MRYHFGWVDARGRSASQHGGKMLRPVLCLLACEAVGGEWRRAVPAAVAIELLHNFTLIHDDVEDASELRHGRPTVWRLWGRELAINAGDGMFALAHLELLRLDQNAIPRDRILRTIRLLDETTLRLCDGQHFDIAQSNGNLTREKYRRMIEGKTAALISAAAASGALIGGANRRTAAALQDYAHNLGLAFQVRDDMLGIWGEEARTGKSSDDDLRSGKQTYPIVAARARARPAKRRAFDRLLAGATIDRRAAQRARDALEELGAREASERTARRYAEAAISALPTRGLVAERARELEALAAFTVERQK
jgi:geranylgeranyl diphosphate synthase type I